MVKRETQMGVLIDCLLAWHGSVEMLRRKEGRRPSQLVLVHEGGCCASTWSETGWDPSWNFLWRRMKIHGYFCGSFRAGERALLLLLSLLAFLSPFLVIFSWLFCLERIFYFIFSSLVFFFQSFSLQIFSIFLILTFEFIYFVGFKNFTVHWNTS